MGTPEIDVLVLREGTEGLSMASYASELRDRLPDHTVRHARTPQAERDLIRDARVVTGVTITPQLLERAESLEVFACTFAGTDHVPLRDLADQGVVVTNAAGIHAPGIADQILGYLLVFARNLHVAIRQKDRREWRHYQSNELTDQTVTVVGLGAIGTAVVDRLHGFPVRTIGVRYTPEKGGPTDQVIGYNNDEFHDALAHTDYLVLACPLTDTTRGLIGPDELATLPPTAVVTNVARGPVIDTPALVRALQQNSIDGAALDVTDPEPLPPDHPLWTFDNVLITPHTGGHNPHHWARLADIVATNLQHLDTHEDPTNLDNLVHTP